MSESDTYAQHMKLREKLLNFTPPKRKVLEVWYGPGNNGKSTILEELLQQESFNWEGASVYSVLCTESHLSYHQWEGKEYVLGIFEDSYQETIKKLSSKALSHIVNTRKVNGKPIRFIMLTNSLTTLLERSNQTVVYRFPHTFKTQI